MNALIKKKTLSQWKMTTFAVQKLYSPLDWNGSGTRRLKGSKFSESEKSMYVQHLCYVGKKKVL